MKNNPLRLAAVAKEVLGYTIQTFNQHYTHTISNYYTRPTIDLTQTNKRKIFHSPDTSQTSIPDEGRVSFSSKTLTNRTAYSSLTGNVTTLE